MIADSCDRCPHPWDGHEVVAEQMAMVHTLAIPVAGRVVCPDCDCTGTWSLTFDHDEPRRPAWRLPLGADLSGYRALRVTTRHASFELDLDRGVVSRVPLVAGYAAGWSAERAVGYFRGRGAEIELLTGAE